MKTQLSPSILAGVTLFAGAVIGLGTGVLIAPCSGDRTRRKVKDFVEDAGEHLHETGSVAKRSMRRFFNRISAFSRLQARKRLLSNFRLNHGD